MYAHARQDLHLAENEFWHLSLRVFLALSKRWREGEDARDFRAGLITSSVMNAVQAFGGSNSSTHFFTPDDFFPHLRDGGDDAAEAADKPPEQVENEFVALMQRQFGLGPRPELVTNGAAHPENGISP